MNFSFTTWNKIVGWLIFLIALITYTLTLEPTTSFWDAGEYIATSANLEVGHPPGAPLYQMLGAFSATFAPNPGQVALMVNFMSALASAFTVLFMFRSSVILLLKVSGPPNKLSQSEKLAVVGAGVIGALTLTFTDSFWFNAVEAEVYAMSICFMALLFYLGLLWERDMFEPRGNRWLLLIGFVIGLSFGVHFLTLLAIPAIGFLYYFKNFQQTTLRNFLLANIAVVAVLLFIFKFLLPYTLAFFATSEVFFTNRFGLPFNSGTIIALLILIVFFYFSIRYTRTKGYFQINTLLLLILFILIGFSSWTMLPVRANANTVINENNPDNARELLAYYNREQYGESYLFYGPQFTEMYSGLDPVNPYQDENPNYERDEATNRYIIVNDYINARNNLDDKHKTILPRMWSTRHAANYMQIMGPVNFTIKQEYQQEEQLVLAVNEFMNNYKMGEIDAEGYHNFLNRFSEYLDVEKPSMVENFMFLLEYQIGYMYWRYFMWNFTGRQNDVKGEYSILNGNWLSGIKFIDEWRLGSQDQLPNDVENNKARNTYYFLPLFLGLLGVVFHLQKDRKMFWVLTVFFLFTGIALKVYLNEAAFQVRERDYALVGSFYVFSIWIGMGVYAFFHLLQKILIPRYVAPVVIAISLLISPALLASQNWDDHDRSNRYTALAMARIYMESLDENAILFTIGDNDTFLMWYLQQIEGYRRDVRIVNTMLFNADWYIDQMKRRSWESEPVPSQLERRHYRAGTNEILLHQPLNMEPMDIKKWMKWISSDHPGTWVEMRSGRRVKVFPTQSLILPVDKEKVLATGLVPGKDADQIVDEIQIELKEDVLYKGNLMMLDIIANNNWERPIYFSGGSFGDEDYLWMKEYLQLEGVVYKLVPIYTPIDPKDPLKMGRIDTNEMYEIVKRWDWGNMGDSGIYHDAETRRNSITYRNNMARLLEELLKEGDNTKALEIIEIAMENMPVDKYGYYFMLKPFINGYFELNEMEKGQKLWNKVVSKYQENLRFYSGWEIQTQINYANTILSDLELYRSLVELFENYNGEELAFEKFLEYKKYLRLFPHFYEVVPE